MNLSSVLKKAYEQIRGTNRYALTAIVILAILCILLGVERVRMGWIMGSLSTQIREKTLKMEEMEHRRDQDAKTFDDMFARMNRRFHIVSDQDVAIQETPFEQKPSAADVAVARKIADGMTDISQASLLGAFNEIRKTLGDDQLFVSPSGVFTSRHTAVFEEICRIKKLPFRTKLHWDMDRWKASFHTETEIVLQDKDPNKPATRFSVSNGQRRVSSHHVTQSSARNAVFPFTVYPSTENRRNHLLFDASANIPLGGAYAHYYTGCDFADSWDLVYTLPADRLPEDYALRALPLLPDTEIASTIAGNAQTFHISSKGKDFAFLIVADTGFLPVAVSCRPKQADAKTKR